MRNPINHYTDIQIIQWQITTRLVGATQGNNSIWQPDDVRPALIVRDKGFRNFDDSEDVYRRLLSASKQHAELESCDAITRLLSLYDVMSAAVIHSDRSQHVLKVFIAPDGYFCDSTTGAYTLSQTRIIKHLLQSVIGSQERFLHWLIIPGTIKWQKQDNPFAGLDKSLMPLTPLNSSAVVLYRGVAPLTLADGRVLNSACFFIEPVINQPALLIPKSPWDDADVYESRELRRTQDLQRHIFAIGSLTIGLEINQEQACARSGTNCLSLALLSLGQGQQSLGLQILLSSGQILDEESLNIRAGGLATSVNGIVALAGEPEPTGYQLFKRDSLDRPLLLSNDFLRRNYWLPKPLQLTGEPESSYCYNVLGREESLIFNYELSMLRIFKPVDTQPVKENTQSAGENRPSA